jgi:16S rRNA (guanine(966)-N(2))-methyltransferase RsmD
MSMRIISGKYGGKKIIAPSGLPVRPTTDFAKTALFNILQHRFDFSKISVADLFAGTGNITYEFLSRGAGSLTTVDSNGKCIAFIRKTLDGMGERSDVWQQDVFVFLKNTNRKFDIIFADPPYDMEGQERLAECIASAHLLNPAGMFILEHNARLDFSQCTGFVEKRTYGHSAFSIFMDQKN